MLKVIGKNGCSACTVLKERLIKDGIEFEYLQFDEIDAKTKKEYMAKAIKSNHLSFPMVFKNDEIIAPDEI